MDNMTLIIAGICLFCVLLTFTIGALLYVSGVLQTVEVGAGTPHITEAIVAYKFATGSYKNAGDLFNEITRLAPKSKAIGIYYDDPQKIPEQKLRYAVGAILGEGSVKVEKDVQEQMLAEGFKLITLPAVTNCVKTSFPYINTLSIMLAVMKVYPQMSRYIQEHKLCAYPMVELYESDYIHFMAPLAKQDEFFVSEAKECIPDEYNEDRSILDGSQTFCDESPSSSCSRSVSTFSYSSRQLLETFGEDDEENGVDDDNSSDSHTDHSDIQDEEITSSVEVHESKATTNLLEEEGERNTDVSASNPETGNSSTLGEENGSLHDSGICSGRTSAVPTELNVSADPRNVSEADGNDSSSSFEEIKMEESNNIPTST